MGEPDVTETPTRSATALPTATADPPRAPTALAAARRVLGWVLETFGPLLAFWIALRLGGLVAAIVVGIATGAALVLRTVVRERRVSPFTAFVAASVAVFGVLDLRYRSGFFVKLEPALGNAATGLFFLGSVLWRRPVILEFAERTAGRALTRARRYLTAWTAVWGAYFLLRAGAYVWMAYHLSLERALWLRAVAGNLSMAALALSEFAVRFALYGRKAFVRAPTPDDRPADSR
jgi:intracellular septation protein A